MSIWGRQVSAKAIAIAVLLVVVGGLVTAVSRTPDREITLVVRDMAFYLEGDPATPNPTITAAAGERIRVVLRNQDRGITHDFAVPAVRAAADLVNWNQTSSVTFDVPRTPGRYEYTCQPHALMMRGTLLVVAPTDDLDG